jgi:hypothetical protein
MEIADTKDDGDEPLYESQAKWRKNSYITNLDVTNFVAEIACDVDDETYASGSDDVPSSKEDDSGLRGDNEHSLSSETYL